MITSLVFFAAMLALAWLLLVQPQRRRRRQQVQMISALAVGDEVITAGGLFGRVREIGDDHVTLEIAPQTQVRVLKSALAGRIEPETAQQSAETPLT